MLLRHNSAIVGIRICIWKLHMIIVMKFNCLFIFLVENGSRGVLTLPRLTKRLLAGPVHHFVGVRWWTGAASVS